MSEQKRESGGSSGINIRIRNMLLVIIVAFCTFGGPYLVYALAHLLKLNLLVSMASGFSLFAVGLALIMYMAWKKIIS